MDLTTAETILGLESGWKMRDVKKAYEKVVAKCQPGVAALYGLTPEMAEKLEKDARDARMFLAAWAAINTGQEFSKKYAQRNNQKQQPGQQPGPGSNFETSTKWTTRGREKVYQPAGTAAAKRARQNRPLEPLSDTALLVVKILVLLVPASLLFSNISAAENFAALANPFTAVFAILTALGVLNFFSKTTDRILGPADPAEGPHPMFKFLDTTIRFCRRHTKGVITACDLFLFLILLWGVSSGIAPVTSGYFTMLVLSGIALLPLVIWLIFS